MSIWGAFANSKTAMLAFSGGMNAISQNIANVSTTGYKRSDIQFKDMLSESTRAGDMFGVDIAHRNLISQQGLVNGGGGWSDLAINGDGFFVVNQQQDGGGDTMFTRNGSFSVVATQDGDAGHLTDANGNYLMGWAANADGTFPGGGDVNSLTAVSLDRTAMHPGNATTRAQPLMNIDSNATDERRVGFSVYDSGSPDDGDGDLLEHASRQRRFEMIWTPTGTNQWSVDFDVEGAQNVSVANPVVVSFDENGRLQSPLDPVTVSVTWPYGGQSTTVDIALDLSSTSQIADASGVSTVRQDGVGGGWPTGFAFDRYGVLHANYDNGHSQALYKLPLATFRAPDALDVRDGGLLSATAGAGEMRLNDITDQAGAGWFVPNALEASTVDLADEFTRMITTQRAYSSSATVFRTSDEMTTLARDLKR